MRPSNDLAQRAWRPAASTLILCAAALQPAHALQVLDARDGVAIWKEPDARMGNFTIFVAGLSGEAVQMKDDSGQPLKDADGNPIILRKTLQLNYLIRGDDAYPGQDEVNVKSEDTVMR